MVILSAGRLSGKFDSGPSTKQKLKFWLTETGLVLAGSSNGCRLVGPIRQTSRLCWEHWPILQRVRPSKDLPKFGLLTRDLSRDCTT